MRFRAERDVLIGAFAQIAKRNAICRMDLAGDTLHLDTWNRAHPLDITVGGERDGTFALVNPWWAVDALRESLDPKIEVETFTGIVDLIVITDAERTAVRHMVDRRAPREDR